MNNVGNGNIILREYDKIVNGIKVYICMGLCNNIATKWVTRSKWDYTIRIQMNSTRTDVVYIDSNGHEMLVFEDDEDEWSLY